MSGVNHYVTVNVYPSQGSWRVVVLVKRSGHPYPHLVSRVGDWPLIDCDQSLEGAMAAAAEVLQGMTMLPTE